ncbi:MAG: hypothetical protein QOC75_2463 [Pseudonocardiales bacterium]|nr:hypothetical protein [Pseudonocardia sp.]MDT7645463.1 hypothetical protein [Pseudonocardiales bacterium]MDT7667855.1 hypothetical protein [Pseudonocardiales bacterium]MDT7750745.1 hypothetical protein [Pseudonocardiales bacterium]
MSMNEPVSAAQHAAIKRRLWKACIWSWPAGLVVFGVGFMLFAGFVPPPSPANSAQQIADMFAANRNGIRVGIILALFGSAMLLPFLTVVSAEIRKIEGPNPLLAPMQFGGAVVLVTFFQIIGLAWLLASFRSDIDPDIVRTLNDYCWFVWSMLIATYMIQYICMAIAGFMDMRPHPIWPRWAAYLNLWVAVTGAGGQLAVFFKAGPFAWNGVVGFWLPVLIFMIGMCVTTALLLRRAHYEATQLDPSNSTPAQVTATGAAVSA